jgi:hypothetical protein
VSKCAANYCRREATVTLARDGITLALCSKHTGTYKRMGYAEATGQKLNP